jgi:beta-galactosidase/beta-glucuronidase
MSKDFEITVREVTDVEARVVARYLVPNANISLHGTLRGPYCETARTLPAEFPFRTANSKEPTEAEAIVPDPCMWSAELPHLYRVDVEALQADRVVAEYHGTIGLRRLAPRLPVDFAPGTG